MRFETSLGCSSCSSEAEDRKCSEELGHFENATVSVAVLAPRDSGFGQMCCFSCLLVHWLCCLFNSVLLLLYF